MNVVSANEIASDHCGEIPITLKMLKRLNDTTVLNTPTTATLIA
jgi:hypothetical protein